MVIGIELSLALVILALVVIALVCQGARGKNYPPGPYQWPFVGNIAELRELSAKLGGQHEAMLVLSKRYASPVISLRIANRNTVIVSGIEAIHAVLNAEEFDGRPWNYFISLRNMGRRKGITMNDGPAWRDIKAWFMRSMKSVGFARREMSDYIHDEMVHVLDRLKDGGVMRTKPIVVPSIINVLWIFSAGKRFDNDRLQYFVDLMDRRAQAFDMMGGLISAYPWLRHVAPEYSGYNLLCTLNNEFQSVLMETIEEHKRNFVPGSEADLIDMFLNEMYSGKGPDAGFDDDQLVVILVDILLAGLNITANSLEFLLLNMLIHRDSQRLVHEEIDRVIGRDKQPDVSDQAKMPYLEAAMLESQRLVPVVPIVGPRRVMRDTKLLGYDIPGDSILLMNIHSIHADPELYPDPYSFKPERFLKAGAKIKDDNLLFFGKGKRQCPGVSLAKTSMFLLFAGIMQRFELLPVPGQEPPSLQVKTGMTMSPKPFDVLLSPRSAKEKNF